MSASLTLRQFLGANGWLAMTAGHTVGSALIKLRDDGVPVDCPAWFAAWKNVRGDGQLANDLRARLTGAESTDPHALKFRDGARRRRILAMFRADGKTIAEIAEADGAPENEIEAIVRGELKERRKAVVAERAHEKAMRKHDAERADRIRAAFKMLGRRVPDNVEKQLAD